MSYVHRSGLGWTSGGVNPLTGEPLLGSQTLVRGPLATGPRVTVVTVGSPTTWPRWISVGPGGNPVDLGTVTGGTWDGSGAQTLPDLVTTGVPTWTWVMLVGLALWLLTSGQKSRGEW